MRNPFKRQIEKPESILTAFRSDLNADLRYHRDQADHYQAIANDALARVYNHNKAIEALQSVNATLIDNVATDALTFELEDINALA